jgi:hypothetical protein
MWTINDFPAYADLSGYSSKGKKACPICMESTCSKWLTYGRKCCYMGHRRYLPTDHRWRMKKRAFDGTQELDGAPVVPNGKEMYYLNVGTMTCVQRKEKRPRKM